MSVAEWTDSRYGDGRDRMGLLAITYFFIYILLFDLFSMYYIYIFKYCNNTDDVPF